MNIIILADKFQKRQKSKGCSGLLKINNEYLIIKQYKIIKKVYPNSKIIYVYGFEDRRLLSVLNEYPEIVKNITLINNTNYKNNNYGGSLELVKQYLDDNIIIMFGDTQITKKLLNKLTKNQQHSQVIVADSQKNKLGCIINNCNIQNIFYDLDNKIEEVYFFIKKDAIVLSKLLLTTNNIKNMFIFELINLMIDNKVIIKSIQ